MTTSNDQQQTSAGVEARLARHGKVSYIEIPAVDLAASAAFYRDVFGWSVRGDSAFDDGDLIGHWVTGTSVSREAGIVLYLYVDDVDATLRKASERGAQTVRAPYPEGNLTVATLRDPAGNLIGIWREA